MVGQVTAKYESPAVLCPSSEGNFLDTRHDHYALGLIQQVFGYTFVGRTQDFIGRDGRGFRCGGLSYVLDEN